MAASPSRPDDKASLEAKNDRLAAEIERLEQELRRLSESEKMYRTSAEISGRMLWAADSEGGVTMLRTPFTAVTGVAEKDALGDRWLGIVHPDDRDRVKGLWQGAVEGGKLFNSSFRIRIADGSFRTMRSRALPLRGSDERIRGWSGTIEDIEEERAAEEAKREAEHRLRESEEIHRVTLDLTRQIVWAAEPDGTGLTLSQRYQELTGMPAEEDARMSIHPDDRDFVSQKWGEALESGAPFTVECRLRMRDSSYRLFRVRAMPLRGEQGQILRWYGITEDVHDQKQAELARRDVEERYRLAAKATNDAIWDHDFTKGVIDWSDNASAIMHSANSPLGRTTDSWWADRIHPDEKLSLVQSLTDAIEGDATRWSGTYRFRRDDGSYADMLDRGFIIRDGEGKAIRAVGAMTDLTERHRAEEEIRRMQAELIHVSRLSAMGAMASTLAHELNQPLTALANFISGAKRIVDREFGETQPALLEAMVAAESGALRAGEIIRRLRELVSRGSVSVLLEHVPRLIQDAAVLAFIDEHKLGVSHRLDLDPAALWVSVDRVQIQQVLINLVRNAVEAMQDSAVREILISTRAEGDMIEFCVEDTGPGIDAEEMETLFSQFMTTKWGGMGIGLPISRTIIEAHGGTIWAKNREAGGASFRFRLPAASGPRDKGQI